MKKISIVLMLILGLVFGASAQKNGLKKRSLMNKNLASGQIVYRNNCITQCANCDSAKGPDQSTIFEYSINLPPQFEYTWFYGEGNAKSTGRTGRYQYCSPGNKSVKVVFQDVTSGVKDSVLTTIKIGQLANYSIKQPKPDTTVCLGDKIVLDPFKTIAKQANVGLVRWYPDGQTTDQITADKTGCYTAKIFSNDGSGCYVEAKIQVNMCGEKDPDAVLSKTMPSWPLAGAKIVYPSDPLSGYAVPGTLDAPQGVAKMLDGTKSLIFYTNGVNVYSRNKDDITYGSPLNGDLNNSQGVTIVPKPSCKGCQSDYYIFTLGKNAKGENQLYYSLVDMSIVKYNIPAVSSKDTIRGGVSSTIRNVLVGPVPTTQRIYAIQGGGDFYWVVAQDANSNVIRKYKVTSTGISAPIESGGGTIVSDISSGNTRISKSGALLANTIPGVSGTNNKIDLFDYNTLDGSTKLLATVDLGPAPPTAYGVEFSPDEKKMYVSFIGDGTATNKSKIVQYDISKTNSIDILNSQTKIYETTGKIGALQLDPVFQTVIYVAIQDSLYLSAIVYPNKNYSANPLENSVKYNSKQIPFPDNLSSSISSGLGLPPSIPSPPSSSSLPTIKMVCEGTKFKFTLDKNLCDPIKNEVIKWKAYKSKINPLPDLTGTIVPLDKTQLMFQNPNTQEFVVDFPEGPNEYYTITAEITNKCVKDYLLDAQQFLIQVIKPFKLENVEKILPTVSTANCTITHLLSPTQIPPQSTISYEWNTGAKTKDLLVNNPGGEFTLTIKDTTGCSNTQKAKVTFFPQKELLQKPEWLICMDEPNPRLSLEVLPLANAINYNWSAISFVDNGNTVPAGTILSTDLTKNKIEVGKDGGYQLIAKDLLGCEVSEKYNIPDKCKPLIIAPTVFNPKKLSSDGSPNKFYPLWNWPFKDIIGTQIPNSTRNYLKTRSKILAFRVFNRWGQLIYQKEFDPSTFNLDASFDIKTYGWDGTYNGTLVPQDTYAWIVEYESIDFPRGKESKSGAVLIVY